MPSVLGPARALAAEGVEPLSAAWGKAVAAAADKHSGLEVYRTMIQQKSTDVTAAIDRSRASLLETGGEDATLEGDLAKLSRLASANQQLYGAKEDLKLAARNAEKEAATTTSAYVVAAAKADIAREFETQMAQARDVVATRARFGLAAQDELKRAEEKYAKAKEDAASAKKAMDDAARKLEESYRGGGLTKFRAADLFLDVRVDTAEAAALVRSAVEADPTLRKLESARKLEEQKYAFALELYRSFFGADAMKPLESTLRLRPVDYKLTLSVYNVFLAEVKRKDAARPLFEKLLFPPMEKYLGEQPYTLPAAVLAYATAATLEREHAKSLADQVNAYYLAATMEETAMRQAIRDEADALAAMQSAATKQKAGLAGNEALAAAQEAYAKARLDAVEKKGTYFNAVVGLHYATGGAFAKRLSGDVRASVGKPPAKPGEAGADASADQPLVTYDPDMESELTAAAERLQAQVEAAAEKAAAEGADEGAASGGTAGGTASGDETASGEGEAGENEVDVTALLLTEFDQLTQAAGLAKQAGAADVAAAMEEKLAAAASAVFEALGLPASPGGPGASGPPSTPEARAAKTAELDALLPYLELGLFFALEAQTLAGWGEDAKTAYVEAELQALEAAKPWTTPDGATAESLPATSVAFAAAPVKLTAAPALIGTTAYVPVRPYAEALGYKVVWDDKTSTATLRGAEGSIAIRVGTKDVAGLSGRIELASMTYMTNGQTFVPVSFFEAVLGMKTYWSESLRQGVVFGEPSATAERSEGLS